MSEAVGGALSATEAPASMSFVQRIVNIFVAPAKVFEFLARKPVWVVPLIVICVYGALLQGIIFNSEAGKEMTRQEFQKSPRAAQLTPEQVDRQIAMMGKIVPISTVIIGPIITFAAAGLVYLLISILLGGEITYKQTLAAWVHVGFIGFLQGAVQTGIVLFRGIKPNTSLAAFLPFLEEDSFVYHFLQIFDLFVLWQLAVLAIGVGMMSRIGTRKAAITLYSALTVIALIIAGIRQAFS